MDVHLNIKYINKLLERFNVNLNLIYIRLIMTVSILVQKNTFVIKDVQNVKHIALCHLVILKNIHLIYIEIKNNKYLQP